MNESTTSPIVFVSYSHDSLDHKRWVSKFANKLRSSGIQVILDQTDLQIGEDIAKFMERSVAKADAVLVICTERYVSKADERKDGTGYEHMIITGELIKNLGSKKFIPIFVQKERGTLAPQALSMRLGVNLGDNKLSGVDFRRLVDHLLKLRLPVKSSLELIGDASTKQPNKISKKENRTDSDQPLKSILPTPVAISPRALDNAYTVTAPMVGTFYNARAPGIKPYVKLGSKVRFGDVLCIIEAMKMMNEIASDRAGMVTAILVKNGEIVEFGQPMFVIE